MVSYYTTALGVVTKSCLQSKNQKGKIVKTNFKVNGKSGSSSSAIAHIERTKSLKKTSTKNNEIKDLKTQPHIIIFNPNKRRKLNTPELNKKTKTQISKQLQTYKTRIKKYKNELEDLELESNPDYKKIELKEKTIQRNIKKIEELENQATTTVKKRPKFAFDFVDIPFSITRCNPAKLSREDYKKFNEIALKIVTSLFEIDKKEIGQVAHLDQSSAHIHLTFHIPDGKTLTEITKTKINENGDEVKLRYSEMQKKFNKLMIEAFPNLAIEEISPSEKKYMNLQHYKKETTQKEQIKDKNLKLKYQNKLRKLFPNALSPSQLLAELDKLAKEKEELEINVNNYQSLAEDLEINIKEKNDEIKSLKNKLEELEDTLASKDTTLSEKSVSRANMSDYELTKEELADLQKQAQDYKNTKEFKETLD